MIKKNQLEKIFSIAARLDQYGMSGTFARDKMAAIIVWCIRAKKCSGITINFLYTSNHQENILMDNTWRYKPDEYEKFDDEQFGSLIELIIAESDIEHNHLLFFIGSMGAEFVNFVIENTKQFRPVTDEDVNYVTAKNAIYLNEDLEKELKKIPNILSSQESKEALKWAFADWDVQDEEAEDPFQEREIDEGLTQRLAQFLKSKREEKQLTVEEVANELRRKKLNHINKELILAYESGKVTQMANEVISLLQVMGYTLDDVLAMSAEFF